MAAIDAKVPPQIGEDLLSLESLRPEAVEGLLDLAAHMKSERRAGRTEAWLDGKSVAMLFRKPSTRTRVSFDVAVFELGGHSVNLAPGQTQVDRGETIGDTGRVLSRYVHAIVVRTFEQAEVEDLATAATVPVINALTDDVHPCQALADLLTIREHFGSLKGRRLAYVGDGNNVLHSLFLAGALAGMRVTAATPPAYGPNPGWVAKAKDMAERYGGRIEVVQEPSEAVAGADVVYTDTWTSMGQDEEREERLRRFAGYQVDEALFQHAHPDAKLLHCLPAHRGEEVSETLFDGPRSLVFDQAENRLHVQKAVLAALVGARR